MIGSLEFRGVSLLSVILASRVIGLFAVFAVFTPYVLQLEQATPWLVGIAFGIYGLVQAICHVPMGMLSDRWGRKPVMVLGLSCFLVGSILTVASKHIVTMIVARILQGMGAIGGVAMAWLADLTQVTGRTRAMAVMGATIGVSFVLAICLGSWLAGTLGGRSVFMIAIGASLLGLLLAIQMPATKASAQSERLAIRAWWAYRSYYVGIMAQHLVLAANFMILPIRLEHDYGLTMNQQWRYIGLAFLFSFLPLVLWSRWLDQGKSTLKLMHNAVLGMMLGQALLAWSWPSIAVWLGGMVIFLSGFNCLEAGLPSLLSQLVAKEQRGQIMGGYATFQFLGLFLGGLLAGWMIDRWSVVGVYYMSTIVLGCWWLGLLKKRFEDSRRW